MTIIHTSAFVLVEAGLNASVAVGIWLSFKRTNQNVENSQAQKIQRHVRVSAANHTILLENRSVIFSSKTSEQCRL